MVTVGFSRKKTCISFSEIDELEIVCKILNQTGEMFASKQLTTHNSHNTSFPQIKIKISNFKYLNQWRIQGGYEGCVPPGGPNSFNFMQFLRKFGQIVC